MLRLAGLGGINKGDGIAELDLLREVARVGTAVYARAQEPHLPTIVSIHFISLNSIRGQNNTMLIWKNTSGNARHGIKRKLGRILYRRLYSDILRVPTSKGAKEACRRCCAILPRAVLILGLDLFKGLFKGGSIKSGAPLMLRHPARSRTYTWPPRWCAAGCRGSQSLP